MEDKDLDQLLEDREQGRLVQLEQEGRDQHSLQDNLHPLPIEVVDNRVVALPTHTKHQLPSPSHLLTVPTVNLPIFVWLRTSMRKKKQ